jgi:hypothetical protein
MSKQRISSEIADDEWHAGLVGKIGNRKKIEARRPLKMLDVEFFYFHRSTYDWPWREN